MANAGPCAGEDARTTAGETPAVQKSDRRWFVLSDPSEAWIHPTDEDLSVRAPGMGHAGKCRTMCGRGRPHDSRRDAGGTKATGVGSCYPTQAKLGSTPQTRTCLWGPRGWGTQVLCGVKGRRATADPSLRLPHLRGAPSPSAQDDSAVGGLGSVIRSG